MALNMAIIDGVLTDDAQRRGGENGPLALNIKHEGVLITPRNGSDPFHKHMFMSVTCWGGLRDEFKDLKAGDTIIAQGELEWNSYETQDGEKKGKVQLVARTITTLNGAAPAQQTQWTAESLLAADFPAEAVVDDDIPF